MQKKILKRRVAFAGFQHGHILSLYKLMKDRREVEVVAAAEDDPVAAEAARKNGVTLTHPTLALLFKDAAYFDIVAVGDYYSRRGSIAIQALSAGKSVISDKPIATSLSELKKIKSFCSKGLVFGCMLDLRDLPAIRTLTKVLSENTIGRVHTVNFMGQHPLLWGTRPGWYFERGKHGGTINDVAIHGIDLIPFLLGSPFSEVIGARVWNDRLSEASHFEVGAQMLLRLKNGTGVMGDVSYLAPDSQGYTVPHYWRFTFHGEKGIAETSCTSIDLSLWLDGEKEKRSVPFIAARNGGYFDDFMAEIDGKPSKDGLTTREILKTAETVLKIQAAAVNGKHLKL